MNSHVVPMWRRNVYGKLDIAHVGGDQVAQRQLDGWYDSPDKVPAAKPGEAVDLAPHPAPAVHPAHQGPFGSVHGEVTKAAKAAVRARGQARINGRFVKARA